MSTATPQWMARIGVFMSLMATAILAVAQWRTWSDPVEVGYGLILCVGTGVDLGILWTVAQAMIHTRLGSQPMFPDRPQTSASLPAPQVMRWIALVTGLLLLWHLWPRLMLGTGLGFGAALPLSACQLTEQAESVRTMHQERQGVAR